MSQKKRRREKEKAEYKNKKMQIPRRRKLPTPAHSPGD
jgi:hypothetical protein